jgi:hypothetical protein
VGGEDQYHYRTNYKSASREAKTGIVGQEVTQRSTERAGEQDHGPVEQLASEGADPLNRERPSAGGSITAVDTAAGAKFTVTLPRV